MPVGLISSVPQVIVVNPQRVAANDLPGLLDTLRKNPGKLNYGSAGNGTRTTWPASCSSCRPRPSSPTSPTAARARRCRT